MGRKIGRPRCCLKHWEMGKDDGGFCLGAAPPVGTPPPPPTVESVRSMKVADFLVTFTIKDTHVSRIEPGRLRAMISGKLEHAVESVAREATEMFEADIRVEVKN